MKSQNRDSTEEETLADEIERRERELEALGEVAPDALRERLEEKRTKYEADGEPAAPDDDSEMEALVEALASPEQREEVELAVDRVTYWEGKKDTIVAAEREALANTLGVDTDSLDVEALAEALRDESGAGAI